MIDKEVYQKALEIFRDKTKWTTGYFAKDGKSNECMGANPTAVCWCSIGVLQHIMNDSLVDCRSTDYPALRDAATEILQRRGLLDKFTLQRGPGIACPVVYINDQVGYKAVVEMFALAVEKAS